MILGDVVFGLSYHHGCCHCSAMGHHRPHEVRHEDDRCLMLMVLVNTENDAKCVDDDHDYHEAKCSLY